MHLRTLCTLIVLNLVPCLVASAQLSEQHNVSSFACPNLYSMLFYPRTTKNITVLSLQPLKVQIDYEIHGPTSTHFVSIQGMICDNGFNQQAANAVCQSIGKNYAAYVPYIHWSEGPTDRCQFTMDSDSAVYVPCAFVSVNLSCLNDAKSLTECSQSTLSKQECTSDRHISILCSSLPQKTTTATAITTITTSTFNPLTNQCSSYISITDGRRRATQGTSNICDRGYPFNASEDGSWIRFMGAAGTRLISSPIGTQKCGTSITGWYTGSHPTILGENVTGRVCFEWLDGKCQYSKSIQITKCDDYFVYLLPRVPGCHMAYCTE
ncbi:unnamed protein product [Adineta ricciae]|uniref:SRCR domain-containing protein n=1 Tax=Adineta ricciae TaxID=249248 RepID=A0A815UZV5_ADIRI|nr:unnamed protein product [Adineta ricciae]CAF1635650.1 unnamed protein product [Adineta ricciae]